MKWFRWLSVLLLLFLSAGYAQAVHEGPGKVEARLVTQFYEDAGIASVWNSGDKFIVNVEPSDNYKIKTVQIFVGTDPLPTSRKGWLTPGRFPYEQDYANPADNHVLVLDLEQDLNFMWGEPYEALRVQNVSIFLTMAHYDDEGNYINGVSSWAYTGKGAETGDVGYYDEFEGIGTGWWFSYEMAKPQRGHFIDAPVAGLSFSTPTHWGVTDDAGAFDYFPGETVAFSIGNIAIGETIAANKLTPLDIFDMADTEDPAVINMARLLQSLDADGYPQDGIVLDEAVVDNFEAAAAALGLTSVDFTDEQQVDLLIDETISLSSDLEGVSLVAVAAEDAKAHLDDTLSTIMFRKNISRTPLAGSAKAKSNIMPVWVPALTASGDPAEIVYEDENGNTINTGDSAKAKPQVITYTDEDPITGAHDVFIAISRDDGQTWKRKNLSRMADKSSFTLANGDSYYGHCKKPVFQIKSNYILVGWTSKFAKGGKPRYAIDSTDEYTFDDPYVADDFWGVSGPQRSHDYTEDGFPEVGEIPYAALWTARVVIDKTTGDISYYKPERLTSGRRDAYQLFLAAAGGAGFAMVWQEDPAGLRPGSAAGPGEGWGGATTNHKTDIWYSFLKWSDFAKIDSNFVAGGDPEHDDLDLASRPKALAPCSLPIRLTDNDAVNTDNLMVELGADGLPVEDADGNWTSVVNPDADVEADANEDGSGSHNYAYELDGLCESFHEFTNFDGVLKQACVTADGRLLDGDTGASRPNIFLQPYWILTKDASGNIIAAEKSAWAIIAYEETKGVGMGPPDHDSEGPYGDEYLVDQGKVAIYHSFDFTDPDLVSAGNIINHPETDENGDLVYLHAQEVDADGNLVFNDDGTPKLSSDFVLDWQGQKQVAYENARRPRFILQPKSWMGASKTVMLVLYKEGQEGMGRPSDIMARRCAATGTGNPYAFKYFVCAETRTDEYGNSYCTKGAQNLSSVTPTKTWINPEAEPDARGDQTKIVEWTQTVDNLADKSSTMPYDDARAHRGAIRGDKVMVGYSWTPNWAASRNAHDKYDFFVRRSFDGGVTWTTDPEGAGTTHTDTFKVYSDGETEAEVDDNGRERYDVVTTYAAGDFEPALNVSKIPNNKQSVIEPRIVPTPGQIWAVGPTYKKNADGTYYYFEGTPTDYPEDLQDMDVVYLAYGTSHNEPATPGEEVEKYPLDLYYSFTQNWGESYNEETWTVNPDSESELAGTVATGWDWLAKGDPEQGECQLRMTPDGSRFYAIWLQEIDPVDPEQPTHFEGSDIWLRRIMDTDFAVNNADGTVPEDTTP